VKPERPLINSNGIFAASARILSDGSGFLEQRGFALAAANLR